MFASAFALDRRGRASSGRDAATRSRPSCSACPLCSATVGVIGVVAYNISSTPDHTVGYYGQKLGAAVSRSRSSVSRCSSPMRSRGTRRRLQPRRVRVACWSASPRSWRRVAVFQVDGYVGPRQQTIAANAGRARIPDARNSGPVSITSLDPLADQLPRRGRQHTGARQGVGCLPGAVHRTSTSRVSIRGGPTGPICGSPRSWAISPRPGSQRAYSLYSPLNSVTDPTAAAVALTQLFPPSGGLGVRLVVPDSMVQPLVQNGWTLGTNVFPRAAATCQPTPFSPTPFSPTARRTRRRYRRRNRRRAAGRPS